MRYIRVYADKTIRKKNSFNWSVVIGKKPAKGKKAKGNVLYAGHGYDTKDAARRQANRHNMALKQPLEIISE